jgi:E2F/DP family winged-helix DNA-binding domain
MSRRSNTIRDDGLPAADLLSGLVGGDTGQPEGAGDLLLASMGFAAAADEPDVSEYFGAGAASVESNTRSGRAVGGLRKKAASRGGATARGRGRGRGAATGAAAGRAAATKPKSSMAAAASGAAAQSSSEYDYAASTRIEEDDDAVPDPASIVLPPPERKKRGGGGGGTNQNASLSGLTAAFIAFLESRPDNTSDPQAVCDHLGIAKRRLYDITNVLEGVNLLEKKGKNQMRWK